jgi:hypothetical protein
MMVQYYEFDEDGMKPANGTWGTWILSEDYEALQSDYRELQKRYDALVNKIGDLYQMA